MLEVSGLAKSFGKQVAVGGLSFGVGSGEVVGLVGANGAGKTTTLLAVAGVLKPDAGSVLIGGVDLAARPVEAKRMRRHRSPSKPSILRSGKRPNGLDCRNASRPTHCGRLRHSTPPFRVHSF